MKRKTASAEKRLSGTQVALLSHQQGAEKSRILLRLSFPTSNVAVESNAALCSLGNVVAGLLSRLINSVLLWNS